MDAGLDIPSGALSDHDSGLLPLDASATPGVQQPTAIQPGGLSGPTQAGVASVYADQVAADVAACQTAYSAGMHARDAALSHYAGQSLPSGSSMGDAMVIPPVEVNIIPPANSTLFPYSGDEPTPAGDFPYSGNEPA